MFFIYFIWFIFIYILNFFNIFIEKYFFIKNNPFFLKKRTFRYLSYFEKLFLVLFYKNGWFENSIANLNKKEDIINHRINNYPIINSFHNYNNKVNNNCYDPNSLKLLIKNFNFFKFNKKYYNLFFFLKNYVYCKNNFLKYLILLKIYNIKYLNNNSYFFFEKKNTLNILKLNKTFNVFLSRSNNKLIFFDLNKWFDWYKFNFDIKKNNNFIYKKKTILKRLNKEKIKNWAKKVNVFKKNINKFNILTKSNLKSNFFFFFKLNINNFFNLSINKNFSTLLKYYKINFSESSVTKYMNTSNLSLSSFFFLRKNKIFNKGRYSRNRQLYRTGVYWCLWLNIIMVYGLYFMFYRFTFNFGYFWWGIMILAFSTIFSRISKYNFYNIYVLKKEFFALLLWYGFILNNLLLFLNEIVKNYFINLHIYNYLAIYKKNFNFFFENYFYFFLKIYKNYNFKKNKIKIIYMWQGMKNEDKSIFRYKTIIHWLKNLYNLIIY